MKKQLLKGALAAVATVGLLAGSAMAATLDFSVVGTWSVVTGAGGNNTLSLTDGLILNTNPPGDSAKFDTIGNLSFNYNINTISSQGVVTFDPGFYANGFQIYDNGALILTADLTMASMQINDSTASLPGTIFTMNLSNIAGTSNYDGTSSVLNALIDNNIGGLLLTLQFADTSISDAIINGYDNGTYSGTGKPGSPVPEPATMMLFGTGLLGLAGVARRKSSK
ncbi:MAG: PEP-CTERM sorting domain-containing protein [Desulfobulbus sp.]|nr:PEP-CTERM sorting domain-containing protein [Desulfobulbus sp.]